LLRKLRSDSRDEHDDEARCARRPKPCALRRHTNRRHWPTLDANSTVVVGPAENTSVHPAKARAGGQWCA